MSIRVRVCGHLTVLDVHTHDGAGVVTIVNAYLCNRHSALLNARFAAISMIPGGGI